MSAPRLLFFTPTGSVVGGVETWLDKACGHFEREGYDVLVGLAGGQSSNDAARFAAHHPDFRSVVVDASGLNREGRIRALQRCIRKFRPDVVLPLGIVEAIEAVARERQRHRECRLVGHAQGNLAPMLADLIDQRNLFDAVVCPGVLTWSLLLANGYAPDRVRHVPNGSDTPLSDRRPGGEELRLGYVGRFSRHDKRVLDLPPLTAALEALGVPFRLTLAGDGVCREELLARLAPLGDRCSYLGAISRDDLYREVYPNLDCLLLFSDSEAFGIVLAEAMMNGVVPVTSQYLGFFSERLVVDGETGLSFPVGEVPTAAALIAQLHADRERLAELSAAAARHAAETYTWERCLQGWSLVLEDVLAQEPVRNSEVPQRVTIDGRLDRWLPPGLVDPIRRARRVLFGSPVPPGGEEWLLFHRDHDPARLDEIRRQCVTLEAEANNRAARALVGGAT